MKKMLITGGTVFVSKYLAAYYVKNGYQVYVCNRGTRAQVDGVTLIKADRNQLGESLRHYHFDIVLDINAYTGKDVTNLLDALKSFEDYILISSSAVYPEQLPQPFREEAKLGPNQIWGSYGTNKIEAETILQTRVPSAYILRPPYLYGPGNNVYREAFVFDCALANRPFYLPHHGEMKLQFFHVLDLCHLIDQLLLKKPKQHIFNVGNQEAISIQEWVTLCYQAVGKQVSFHFVDTSIDQRSYFSFYNYEYALDVQKQATLLPETLPLALGIQDSFQWYIQHNDEVKKKPFLTFIDQHLNDYFQ